MKFFMPMSVHVIYFNLFIPTIWLTSDKILLLHCRQIKHYIHGNDPHYIHGNEQNSLCRGNLLTTRYYRFFVTCDQRHYNLKSVDK